MSANAVHGQPVDVDDMLNKYGTYQIQPTADSENAFPKIAQGLPKKEKKNK
ncbi:MAG: hypothetical protein MJ091_04620 [Clostridia bacterium]|nr:hypothetical protein [Clostridia bacterium]